MVTDHFRQRVYERIGDVDPDLLAEGLIWAIQNDRADLVRFVTRASRRGDRFFKFRAATGQVFFALVNTLDWKCVTVYPVGFRMNRIGKPPIDTGKMEARCD